jgi:hypothetical protein
VINSSQYCTCKRRTPLYYDIRSYITTLSRRQKRDTLKTTSWFLKAVEASSLELVIHSWMCELQGCSNTTSLFSYPIITWQISFIYIYRDINAEENHFDGPPNFRMHNFDAFKKIEYKIQNFIQQQQEAGIFYFKIYQDMFFCFVFGSFFNLCFAL